MEDMGNYGYTLFRTIPHCPIVRSAEKHKTYTLKWERKIRRALHKTTLLCMKQAFEC